MQSRLCPLIFDARQVLQRTEYVPYERGNFQVAGRGKRRGARFVAAPFSAELCKPPVEDVLFGFSEILGYTR